MSKRFLNFLNRIEKYCMIISVGAIMAIMLLTTFDVVSRKFFGYSVPSLYEIVEQYLIVAMIFPVMSYVYVKGGNVRVTLFLKLIPKVVMPVLNKLLDLLAFGVFAIMFIMSVDTTVRAFEFAERSTNLLHYPMWTCYVFVPIGLAMLTIRLLQKIISPDSILMLGDDSEVETHS